MRLATRLLALLLAAVLPIGAAVTWMLQANDEERVSATREAALQLARTVSLAQEAEIRRARAVLATLAQVESVRIGDTAACAAITRRLDGLHEGFSRFAVLDDSGRVYCAAGKVPDEQRDWSDRGYFREVMATGRFALGNYVIGRLSGKPVLVAAYPVADAEGTTRRIVVVGLTTKWFAHTLEQVRPPPGAQVGIVDAEGRLVTHLPGDAGDDALTSTIARARADGARYGSTLLSDKGLRSRYGGAWAPLGTWLRGVYVVAAMPVDHIRMPVAGETRFAHALRSIPPTILVLAGTVFTLLMLAAGHYMLVVRHIDRLARVCRRLAAGDLAVRSNLVHRDDEIGALAGAFDTMAGALERRNAEFEESVSALAQSDRELRHARDDAESANRAKSTFLAAMSHELRTPLNSIIGYSEMLAEDAESRGDREGLADLHRIHSAGRHLLELINDILDLSKVEAGRMELVPERLAVSALVADAVETVRPSVEARCNRLHAECDENVGEITSDATKVRQILLNLLSNAGKFTESGEVRIEARREDQSVVFRISDTGIGMDEAQLARLFQPFVQGDPEISRRYGGTGLGLALSRRLCDLLGGEIEADSTRGKGSVFSVRLPVELPAAGPREAPDSPRSCEEATPEGQGPLVLVIDDEVDARDLLSRRLREEGYRVLTAAGGRSGLRLAREFRPALVTLDVLMPDIDGWEVLKRLKGDEATRDIPVVMCTIVDDEQHGFALGATDYLTKPIDRVALARILHDYRCGDPQCRALVVDDDPASRELLGRALRRGGWEVDTAEHGRAALDCLAEHRPDLVLLDLMMPEMDGFEFLEQLRAHTEWREIPVVVVTAKSLTDEDRARLNGYVEHVVAKGGDGRPLLSDVTGLIERALERERRRGRDRRTEDRRRERERRRVETMHRAHEDRRQDSSQHAPDERRSGAGRRTGGDRRSGRDRRQGSGLGRSVE